jgi:hypothetical protein
MTAGKQAIGVVGEHRVRSRFGLSRLGFRSRVLVAALLPSVAIALALAIHFTSTRIADIEQSLIDRAALLSGSLAPASEYGLFAATSTSCSRWPIRPRASAAWMAYSSSIATMSFWPAQAC